jgi:hypothetical protein
MEFIQKSAIVTAMVGLLNAVPHTRLYDRLRREGRLLGQTSGDNVDGTTNFVPRMRLEKLREGYHSILRHIYAPGPYYRRVRTFLREYHPPRMTTSINWQNIRALIHSSLWLGVFGRERFHYWGLLLWTFCRRPAALQIAITLAIYGHHFRKTCEALRV